MSKIVEVSHETRKDGVLFRDNPPKIGTRQNGNHAAARPLIAQNEEVKLVQRIFLLSQPSTFRTVVFCGVEQEDGASLICAHVGTILAGQRNKSVCIVDADARTCGLHEYFGVSNEKGLTEALLHFDPIQNYVQKLAIANLWLMPCRPVSAGTLTSLAPDRLRQRLVELRDEFEYVLIHAPAASMSDDAVQLGQLADGVVLVVRANATHRETARKAKENLQSGNVTLLGAVLNNRRFPIPEALYHRL
jgi:polysaccharide biosynthesis transport protein